MELKVRERSGVKEGKKKEKQDRQGHGKEDRMTGGIREG